jgi:SAM-dependent methyltransferase
MFDVKKKGKPMADEGKAEVFQAYADVYDSLYSDKDYESECDLLEKIFQRFDLENAQSILDLGCGTGGHVIPLARRGYKVFGIDRSAKMLAIARQKIKDAELSDKVQLQVANIQDYKLNKTFDIVISMFAVLSYQISNDELFSTISAARRHVKTGGLFIADFWYGPAVLSQQPEEKVKSVRNGNDRIIRIVKPDINTQKNVVTVNYDIIRLRAERLVEEIEERHLMRFTFRPEIEFYLNQAEFELEHFCGFGDLEKKADQHSWNVMIVARAV